MNTTTNNPSMTMAEKILARASGRSSVSAGDYVTASLDRMMINDTILAILPLLKKAGVSKLKEPDKAVVMFDHFFPAPSAKHADLIASASSGLEPLGIKHFLGSPGIAHQVMCERGFVKPGELVLGSDSHSTMYGALGAAGAGIGITEVVYWLATGSLWFEVPETIQFELQGKLSSAVSSKDIVLHLIGKYGGDYGQYRSIEYVGEAASALSISERMTISNMGAEFGAKFAMFESDERTRKYLSEILDESMLDEQAPLFASDQGANYFAQHVLDVSELQPQLARPGNPERGCDVSEAVGTKIHQAYLGSCTNAREDDLEIAAQMIKGKKVAPGTRLLVAPASQQVMLNATKAGHVEVLLEAGAHMLPPGCGACAGLHGGLLGAGEVCISSTNRNFNGRMGSIDAEVYLGSPATVIASAVNGCIADPREFC